MDQKEFCLLVLAVLIAGSDAMTRQQLKNSGKMLKKHCIGKTGATEEQVKDIDKGVFIEEKVVMCYFACIYQVSQLVKNNKVNYEALIKQIDVLYPADLKEAAKASIEKCRDVQNKYKDFCEVFYWTTKCLYDNNPKAFIFA